MRRSLALLPLLLAACGGGSDSPGTVTPPPTPTIALSLAPAAGTAARGATTTTTVTLTRGGGYTGTVNLAADGVPSGVQVTLSPTSLTGTTTTATATVTVGATAAPGTASFSIVGTGTGVSAASSTFALTVPTPTIGVTTSVAALSVTQGTAGNVGITVSRTNGFTDAVNLTASGLPTGVTATFAPASVASGATASTLVLAAAANTAPGTYPVTVTAAGTGVANVTATVTLTVTAAATPAFGLSASPAALSLTPGQSGTSAITVVRSGGFAGDVALTVAGAPTGMTASVTPATVAANATTATVAVATTAAVAPGTYTLTVNGTGTGVTAQSTSIAVTVAAAPGITVSAASATLSATAGATATTAITLARLGNFAGDVTLSVGGLPSGVTAAFAPATLTGATLASTLTLTVGAAVPAGTYTLSVNAAGAGGIAAQTPLTLTVTAAQGYTLSATQVNLTQGGTATSAVTITRTGNFAGSVALAVTGLPNGVTATVNPASTTGTSATITLTATGNAATGNFSATVTGTATGLANVTAALTGNVAGAPTGGSISWTFCETTRFPVWFAVQNGTGGAWTAITPSGTTNRVYSFSVNNVGAVAYAIPREGGGTDVTVQYLTATELNAEAQQECTVNRRTKTLSGTVANVPAGSQATIGMGGGSATVDGPMTTFNIQSVDDGPTDLLGVRATLNATTFSQTPDRAVLRRNVNYAAGSSIPTIDFTGGESFPIASANYTVANAGSDLLIVATSFLTANGFAGDFSFPDLLAPGNSRRVYGVPASRTVAGDQHQVLVLAASGNENASAGRIVAQYNRDLVDRTITLGPAVPAVTPTLIGGAPYRRFTVSGNWLSEYADGLAITYSQASTASNSWTVSLSRTYAGAAASTWTLALPDFSGVTGFNSSWALANASTNFSFTAFGGITTFVNGLAGTIGFTEGGSFRAATRSGSVAP